MTATDGNIILLTFFHFSVCISIYFDYTVLLACVDVLHGAICTSRTPYNSYTTRVYKLYLFIECRHNSLPSRYQNSLTAFTAY